MACGGIFMSLELLILIVFILLLVCILYISVIVKKSVECLNRTYEPDEITVGEGKKLALIIYQPTRHGSIENISMAIAEELALNDYKVILNYPSKLLNYRLNEYDLICFGGGVYFSRTSPILSDYILSNPCKNKKVLVYLVGRLVDEEKEINELAVLLGGSNKVYKAKVKKDQTKEVRNLVSSIIKE